MTTFSLPRKLIQALGLLTVERDGTNLDCLSIRNGLLQASNGGLLAEARVPDLDPAITLVIPAGELASIAKASKDQVQVDVGPEVQGEVAITMSAVGKAGNLSSQIPARKESKYPDLSQLSQPIFPGSHAWALLSLELLTNLVEACAKLDKGARVLLGIEIYPVGPLLPGSAFAGDMPENHSEGPLPYRVFVGEKATRGNRPEVLFEGMLMPRQLSRGNKAYEAAFAAPWITHRRSELCDLPLDDQRHLVVGPAETNDVRPVQETPVCVTAPTTDLSLPIEHLAALRDCAELRDIVRLAVAELRSQGKLPLAGR